MPQRGEGPHTAALRAASLFEGMSCPLLEAHQEAAHAVPKGAARSGRQGQWVGG
jgi:hypothetical protein